MAFRKEKYSVTLLKGDGIGPEVIDATTTVVDTALNRFGGGLAYRPFHAGANYYAQTGYDLEPGAEKSIEQTDAILLGAIGLPDVRDKNGTEISPHLRIREQLGLYAGVRPVKAYANGPQMLADERASQIDLVILRESSEGLFYTAAVHDRNLVCNDHEVTETLRITRSTTEKLHDFAFKLARRRQEKKGRSANALVSCVDKANVFRSMAFFRQIFKERAKAHPDIDVSFHYVDALALDLIRRPWDFDVLVMENMFGDIMSDLAGGLVGG